MDNRVYDRDIQTTGSHISNDQHGDLVLLEQPQVVNTVGELPITQNTNGYFHRTINRGGADIAGIQQRLPITLTRQTYRNKLSSLASGHENERTAGIWDDIAE